MNDKKCKICRRAGEKLFLKGDKCFTPKCPFEKKAYPPGKRDSERKHRSTATEYGIQLREKQKVRNVYRLSEKQFSNYVKKVTGAKGVNPSEKLLEALETRLDNVVFRVGLAKSRSAARQIVAHGHITLNGRRTMIPSRPVKVGDIVKIRKESLEKKPFAGLTEKGNKAPIPAWLTFDPKTAEAVVRAMPTLDKGVSEYNLTSVIEFYSR
jgi:small subunit ribosomal protein S4